MGRDYERSKGIKNGLLIDAAESPNCKINADGSVNLSTCTCNQNYTFDSTKKLCVRDPKILTFYADNCSTAAGSMRKILKLTGINMIPPPEISFGACMVERFEFKVAPHAFAYKLYNFAYFKTTIKKTLEIHKMKADDVKLVVSAQEVEDYKNWLQSYSSPEFSESNIKEMLRHTNSLKFFLEEIVIVVEE